MDYEILLKKYMKNVSDMEGVFFIPSEPDSDFSQEELDLLNKISQEINDEDIR